MGEKEEKTVFKPFKITTKKRYWEDEDFGILVKRDRDFTIYAKHLRSYMLKFSIVRGDVFLVKGEKTIFAFKGRIMSIVGGDDKNLITIISENGKKVNRKLETRTTAESIKKVLKKDDVIVVKEPSKTVIPKKPEVKVEIVKKITIPEKPGSPSEFKETL